MVAAFHNRGTKSVEAIAEKAGVTTATVYQWVKQEREGTLHDPENPTPRQGPFPAEVRAKAVAEYLQHPDSASVIAHALGITPNKLYKWASRAKQEAEQATQLARTGSAHMRAAERARVPAHAEESPQQISLNLDHPTLTQELLRERHKTAKLKNMLIRTYQEHAERMISIVQEM